MAFEFWPYTNYHDLNLDYILRQVVKALADSAKAALDAADALNYAKTYFDSPEFSAEVDRVLDRMATDGTLERIINEQIFNALEARVITNESDIAELKTNVATNTFDLKYNVPFAPALSEHAACVQDMLSCIASYFAVEYGSRCVVGTPTNIPQQVLFRYYDGHGYTRYMRTQPSLRQVTNTDQGFNALDRQTKGGAQRNVMCLDCSTFVSLITKARHYLESPYYYVFSNMSTAGEFTGADSTLLSYCLENGTLDDKPYTFDWLNNITTYRMAYMSDAAGNTLRELAFFDGSSLTIDNDIYKTLETGDIVFFGRSRYQGQRYNAISHVGIYVKSLDELNQYMSAYGVELRPYLYDNDDESRGYVVHVTEPLASEDPNTDVLRIETLTHQMSTLYSQDTWRRTFVTKPHANALLSSKSYNMFNSRYPMLYGAFDSNRYEFNTRMAAVAGYGTYYLDSLQIDGLSHTSGTYDLNTIEDGYHIFSGSSVTVSNKPSSSTSTVFYVISCMQYNSYRGLQLFVDFAGRLYYRLKNSNTGGTTWTDWKQVTAT